jgi:DNA-directed RNA polymerase specialized sigma24 family protein
MTTTPATKPTRSRKAATTPEPVVETKPAARKRAAKAETPVVETPKPEPKPVMPKISDAQRAELIAAHEAMLLAAAAFEVLVVSQIVDGVSPSTIGTVTGIPTSSVRRLIKRRHPDLVK